MKKFRYLIYVLIAVVATTALAVATDKYISSQDDIIVKTAASKKVNLQNSVHVLTDNSVKFGQGAAQTAIALNFFGKKTADGSGVATRFVSLGYTFSVDVFIICRISESVIASGNFSCVGSYGATGCTAKTASTGAGGMSGLTIDYENTEPRYLRFSVIYTGGPPVCDYFMTGFTKTQPVAQ